jgi:hypothetical protein
MPGLIEKQINKFKGISSQTSCISDNNCLLVTTIVTFSVFCQLIDYCVAPTGKVPNPGD